MLMPKQRQQGFTIVELLIVIVVIAILAAISVVAYTGVQNRAHNTAVQSDLKNIATKIEMYNAEQGAYPANVTVLSGLGLKATKSAYELTDGIHASHVHNLLYCATSDRSQFALVARAKSGDAFQYSGGTVGPYGGPLQSGTTQNICESAGVTVATSADWIWFYTVNAWRTWLGD